MRFDEMGVFAIVGMGAAGHFGPGSAQTGIAESFEAEFGGVVANDGVVAEKVEEFAAAFGAGSKFGFIGKLFEKSGLLRGGDIEEKVLVFGFAAGVEPFEAAGEGDLFGSAAAEGFFDGAGVIVIGDGDAVGEHEVYEFGDASGFGAGSVVGGNDHFGEVIDQVVLV